MDNLVSRLRIEARRDPEIQHSGHSILSDAADEIERLRAASLSKEELNLVRQWFNAVEDLHPKYLEKADRNLADKILTALGMKPRDDEQEGAGK